MCAARLLEGLRGGASLRRAFGNLVRNMVRVRGSERRRGTTLVGPHRDDLGLLLDGRDARLFASQGQQRTAALALRLAELRLLTERKGEPPLLLLDDVLSELDAGRRTALVALLRDQGQTLVTAATSEALPPADEGAAVFWVEGGNVLPLSSPEPFDGRLARGEC
jgi:DNA replication and repair protein RecF